MLPEKSLLKSTIHIVVLYGRIKNPFVKKLDIFGFLSNDFRHGLTEQQCNDQLT